MGCEFNQDVWPNRWDRRASLGRLSNTVSRNYKKEYFPKFRQKSGLLLAALDYHFSMECRCIGDCFLGLHSILDKSAPL